MKIDGRLIASEIKENLKKKVLEMKSHGITPRLAIILIGSDPSSQVYVRQKLKVGEQIGAKVELFIPPEETPDENSKATKTPPRWPEGFTQSEVEGTPRMVEETGKWLINTLDKLNHNPSVHGIIVQRPVPLNISDDKLDLLVIPQKDVDAFHPDSPFTPPIALAVLNILKATKTPPRWPEGFTQSEVEGTPRMVEESNSNFHKWLSQKSILIIGRGETGGKPIAQTFKKMGIPFHVAHSQTTNLKDLIRSSDIIISCVGKPNIIRREFFLSKANDHILIGVGMHEEGEKLKGDYNEDDIKDIVSMYTPVPGGVGPVNVACLFENLLKAVKLQVGK